MNLFRVYLDLILIAGKYAETLTTFKPHHRSSPLQRRAARMVFHGPYLQRWTDPSSFQKQPVNCVTQQNTIILFFCPAVSLKHSFKHIPIRFQNGLLQSGFHQAAKLPRIVLSFKKLLKTQISESICCANSTYLPLPLTLSRLRSLSTAPLFRTVMEVDFYSHSSPRQLDCVCCCSEEHLLKDDDGNESLTSFSFQN